MRKSAEGEGRIRASSHSLQRWQHASPNTPLASLLLVLLREGHEAGKCQAWGSPTALFCIKQSLGIPVLSSIPTPTFQQKIYIHFDPGVNGGSSWAYQGRPSSKFWRTLGFSMQILFYFDSVQPSSQDSRMLGCTTSRGRVDQNQMSSSNLIEFTRRQLCLKSIPPFWKGRFPCQQNGKRRGRANGS